VSDYLLFIDSETSGLPKKWGLPYSAKNNWPFCVQIAWVIYTKEGQKVKQENHFIKESDFKISRSAIKIHGITHAFLQAHGQRRHEVMKMLSDDVCQYQPLVVGHFMEFDYHMMSVDFYRSGIENPVKKEITFCTMLATTHLVKKPLLKFLRLGELYEILFETPLKNQHDAQVDAKAASDCFFELIKRGEINDEIIINQQKEIQKPLADNKTRGCFIPALFIISLFLLIFIIYE
jgi:DNA polymerase-3 subunit epsilon